MRIDLLVQEFYALEAVSAMVAGTEYGDFQPMQHSHRRWYEDFSRFRDRYISKFASAIYDYTVLVTAAELRHMKRKASHYIKGYYDGPLERNEVYQDCVAYRADDILHAGYRMFDPQKVKWEEDFGGEKWWYITKAGLMKGKFDNCTWIDHCVDLSHNGNIYFDKGAGIFALQSREQYKEFLDLKRDCEPKKLLERKFGYHFARLLWRASNLQILTGLEIGGLLSPLEGASEQQLLCYSPIQWGKKHLNYSDRNILANKDFYGRERERVREDEDERYEELAKSA